MLDLLTGEELAGLVAVCAGAGCPVLLTMSVVGRVDLNPADPLDAGVAAAFNAHQRRTTERGRLLGPDAVAVAVEGSADWAAEVLVRPSPWRLGACRGRPGSASGSPAGWAPRASSSPSWPPRPAPTHADVWRRQAAGRLAVTVDHARPADRCAVDGSRRARSDAPEQMSRTVVGVGPPRWAPPRRSPSWSGAWAPARSSTASARSTAGRWRQRPASGC